MQTLTPSPSDLATDFVRRRGLVILDALMAQLDALSAQLAAQGITVEDCPDLATAKQYRAHLAQQMEQAKAAGGGP